MEQTYLPGTIQERMQDQIKEKKITQGELAAEIGISESALSRFLSGKTDKIGDDSIIKIADFWGVSTDFILGQTDFPERRNYDIEELGLSFKAAMAMYTREVDTDVVNRILENPQFPAITRMIAQYFKDAIAEALAGQNAMWDTLQQLAGTLDASHLANPQEGVEATVQILDMMKTSPHEKDIEMIQTALMDNFLTYAAPAIRHAMSDMIHQYSQNTVWRLRQDKANTWDIVHMDGPLDDLGENTAESLIASPHAKLPEQICIEQETAAELHEANLQNRDNGVAGGSTPAGGKNDSIAAACNHGRDGRNVIACSIHQDGAGLGGTGSLLQHLDHRTGTALADAAQALFVQCRQAARFIARGGLAGAAILTVGLQVRFIVFADLDDLVVDLRRGGPLGQHVFAANPLDGFTHEGGSAHIHQEVAQLAHGGVAGDAGCGVGAAALDAQQQFRYIAQLLLLHGGFSGHIAGGTHRFLDGFQGAALILDAKRDHGLTGLRLDLLAQFVVRHCLTA